MTSQKFLDFVARHELVTYLTLIPSFILTMISLSSITIGIFAFHIILVLVGTFVMYKKYALEKSVDFTEKLSVFVEEFKDKIIDPAYNYSLPSFALEVARSEKILEKTQAWDELLSKLSEDLVRKTYSLHEKIIVSTGNDFPFLFDDYCHVLTLLRKFKERFYKMVDEYGKVNFSVDFSTNKQFYDRFKKLSEKYNGYMNRLVDFSDDLKAEMSIKLDDKLIEHIGSARELFMTH